ncbi:MAG: site-specific DNA-methyltransferase [Phycisphaeraceae bacterium]|nr:site-specific DNA-methyltransferase [Phycisphaeraceae bacterium]
MRSLDVQVGDWLDLAGTLGKGSVDFLYVDPPFNTGVRRRTPPGAGRAGRAASASYADSWPTAESYIAWLEARVRATVRAMKPTGVVAIHCDDRASHRIRLMLDRVLGEDRFINHLIWRYGLGGSSARRFARKHDDIIVYGMEPDGHYFDPPMVAATSRRMRGMLKKATDVIDIPAINNMARERTGYPTQKPEALLSMLVGAFCPPGGLTVDPCCGSGTTLAAAVAGGRRALGFDSSEAAAAVARARLASRARA